jgi:hypothetical protein
MHGKVLARPVIITLLLAVSALGAWAQSPAPPSPQTTSKKKEVLPSKHSAWATMGESEGDTTETPEQLQHRQDRERHLGTMNPFTAEPYTDPGGEGESVGALIIDTIDIQKLGTENVTPEPHGVLVWGSNAVVIGTVLSGKSHMNSAHNNVYTDYQIRVDEILKPDKTANLTVGQPLVASRTGGKIRFPSGHITDFFIQGRGLPKVGSQYILFLKKTSPDLSEYRIGWPSSYELKDGKVYPLDDANQEYEGFSASAFLGLVRDTIAASKGGK